MARRNKAVSVVTNKKFFLVASFCLAQPVWAQSIITTGSVVRFSSGGRIVIAPGNQGASLVIPDNLLVADSGLTGTMTIQDGAVVSVANATGVSNTPGSSGTLNINNGGVLLTGTLGSASSVTTNVNFDGGILRANSNQASFISGFLANTIHINSGGAYFDTQGFTVSFNNSTGIINGSGTLTKQGSGTLNITGSNTWTGGTGVSAGTLGFTTYNQISGQTLTIGASSSANYGKLNVTGVATFNAGANLAVDVASVNTLAKDQTLSGVISAGTLNATTFNVTDNSALLNFTAVRNGNTVDLNVSSASTIFDAANNQGMRPAYAAARILDTWSSTGDTGTVISAFNRLPDQSGIARAVNQTLPQNGSAQATMGALSSINRIIAGRFANTGSGISSGEESINRQVWIKPFGSYASQDDANNVSGFKANTYGLAAGIETDIGSEGDTRVGLSYAYASTRVNGNTALTGTDSNTKIDSNLIAVYASKPLKENLALNLQMDLGWNDNRSARNINFGGINRTANGSYGALSFHTGASLSQAISIDPANTFFPSIRADYTRLKGRSYTETGADALNLSVDGKTTEAFVIGVDGRVVHAIDAHSQVDATVGAGYDTINNKGDLVASYAGTPGQSFVATGLDHGPWLFKAGLGYTYKFKQGTDISVRYDAEGRSGFMNQAASIKAAWQF
ncbi:autotransporter domain-containing protein [Herbaspirillum sp. WKF16]|uniref:autotransporter family protein n=1 Tax=Herbaspirillum sp. WKF16 TaxID=3028312 RepID=UPI0023A95692|nr:autotransporter outer membrane beta-barrel domain-containing protein [Herbaspirillum sp. WKF16]WDZ95787.1 autotransporter domain-containing protein [Herbaspirillum sp. WKF16]